MKIFYPLAFAFIFSIHVFAQNSNAILFTENGERFQVVLNGVIQNITPATNVKLTDLIAPNYKMKIIFEDKSLGEIDKNLFLEAYAETSFNIKRKSNGDWVVRILSITPLAQLPPAPPIVPNQNVVVYHATPIIPPPPVTTTTTTTTTYNDPLYNNDNVNINFGVNGMGLNMNINGTGTGTTTSQTTTTYSTTTTTSPTTVYTTPPPTTVYTSPTTTTVYTTPPPTTVIIQEPTPVYVVPGYNGPTGCQYPMNPQDFAGIKASIMSKSFENTKLEIAKQVLGQRCMTSSQVSEIISVFDFESTKLDFAKFAYGRTFDLGNYYQINDAFTFESSISDLNNYINSYRR
jgi:hypothetical protein